MCLPLGERIESKGAKEPELLKRFMTEFIYIYISVQESERTDLTIMETLFFSSQVSLHFIFAERRVDSSPSQLKKEAETLMIRSRSRNRSMKCCNRTEPELSFSEKGGGQEEEEEQTKRPKL